MKKNILLLSLLSILLIPISVSAQTGIVPCTDNCTLTDFITMIGNIYNFIVFSIATPLAVIAIIIGGVLIMTSAGDPNRMSVGKKVFWSAIIGLFLAFATKVIINFVLTLVGYTGNKF